MNQNKWVKPSFQLIRKDLGLEEDFNFETDADASERLKDWLTQKIKQMLDTDFQGLMNALYRVDVPEKKVVEILELEKPDEIANKLAEAVIEREKQKVITRQVYRPS